MNKVCLLPGTWMDQTSLRRWRRKHVRSAAQTGTHKPCRNLIDLQSILPNIWNHQSASERQQQLLTSSCCLFNFFPGAARTWIWHPLSQKYQKQTCLLQLEFARSSSVACVISAALADMNCSNWLHLSAQILQLSVAGDCRVEQPAPCSPPLHSSASCQKKSGAILRLLAQHAVATW